MSARTQYLYIENSSLLTYITPGANLRLVLNNFNHEALTCCTYTFTTDVCTHARVYAVCVTDTLPHTQISLSVIKHMTALT